MERLDKRAIDRINGPAWALLRLHYETIHTTLIEVSPDISGSLTTIYVKYTSPELKNMPFAVVWIKKASEIVVGLALPPDLVAPEFSGPPAGCKYAGLTGYFKVKDSDDVPSELAKWAAVAYDHTRTQCNA